MGWGELQRAHDGVGVPVSPGVRPGYDSEIAGRSALVLTAGLSGEGVLWEAGEDYLGC